MTDVIMGKAGTGIPGAGNRGQAGSGTGSSAAGNPVTGNPVTGNAVTGNLVTGNLLIGNPVTGDPLTGKPGMDNPRMDDFGTGSPPAAGLPAALSVAGVSHAYGPRKALDNVSLVVPQSRFTALLGLNGAGKTTLFSLITRLYDTRAGAIEVLGYRISRDPGEALRRLGVVFQARTLDLDLSVMDNLLYHAALHGIGGRDARARATAALREIDLSDRARDPARKLSGGQMRRVEIARALMHEPRVLVLDEATVGLDVNSKSLILRHVRSLVRDRGVAVLWATHSLDEVAQDDAVVVLHRGRVVAAGDVAAVIEAAGAPDLRSAFVRLTGGGDAE